MAFDGRPHAVLVITAVAQNHQPQAGHVGCDALERLQQKPVPLQGDEPAHDADDRA